MIDQSHNIKPKVAAMIQTCCTIQDICAKALCVDRKALAAAQERENTIGAEETLRAAFNADVKCILRDVRKALGVPADPLGAYLASGHEQKAARQRRAKRAAIGISSSSSYA
jgi:L-rhamnose isomerase/sugar isomerase